MKPVPTKHIADITVIDPDSHEEIAVEIRKCLDSGAMVGLDGSYLETDNEVRNPYNQGFLEIPDNESLPAKTFYVEQFGCVGQANLMGFVKTSGKDLEELEIGEGCTGTIHLLGMNTESFRITRQS